MPATGSLAPDATIDFDFDITSIMDEGTATYTVEIISNNDGSVAGTYTFEVFTPSEPRAMNSVGRVILTGSWPGAAMRWC